MNGFTVPSLNFNSIKVRLNLTLIRPCGSVVWFQFHKGTIKPDMSRDCNTTFSLFQFHKGTIKPVVPSFARVSLNNFNSIKVRLNLLVRRVEILIKPWFQFHKGTIKPHSWWLLSFHFLDFNSIKVRLNRLLFLNLSVYEKFQFHKGTIKPSLLRVLLWAVWNFNSIKVRLNPSKSLFNRIL